jgi:hypothetical protein
MTRAEREKLIEEKNIILGQQKDSQIDYKSTKRKIVFNTNINGADNKEKESNLTEADRALLKVFDNFLYNDLNYVISGKILRYY